MNINLRLVVKWLMFCLFILSALAKLYPTPMYGITKIFEEGQLIPMGFSEGLAPYFSRIIIGVEFFIAFAFLQNNFIKRIIIPSSILLLIVFSLHLCYSIFLGDSENCGCFGELIPMTPTEVLIKNIVTIFVLIWLYRNLENNLASNFSKLIIQFLSILLLMFAFFTNSNCWKK